MKSINFEFLRPKWPEIAGLGGFAEAYAHPDPVGSISKLRVFCEQVVEWIHFHQRLPKPFRANLNDLLHNQPFKDVIPEVILSKLHSLRMEGNSATHGNKGDTTTAQRLIREAYNIARWLHVNYASGNVADFPEYTEPPEGGVEGSKQRREKRAILERVVAQEAQMQKLLADLENERSRAAQAEATAEERQAALQAAIQATQKLQSVDPMAFNELETRNYLIDQMLADEGWQVGKGNTDTEEVKKEYPLIGQPTDSGSGAADYVLFDDNGKSLAVLEAKSTSKDASEGRKQAEMYADALEKQHHQRPVIFYTNGYDLWIWNDAAGEPPRKIYGFYSKDSLQHVHFQRSAKKPLSEISANPNIAGRIYQIEAVRRVVERFADKKRKALIVQATGTGKTRVAISLCDAMIKGNWAKRILFLCDRRELRRQANNAFNEFLPSLPRTYVTGASAGNSKDRIFLSTYPAMMKIYQSFDVGFFDLIIADESHRSLYNRYRQLFEYFDCYQLGLTATPVDFVSRNTFKIFECDEGDPTSYYDYPTAVAQKHLVPFEVDTHTTPFLRDGIKYSKMTPEQRRQLEEDEELPQIIEFEQVEVDKVVYNKDTNRHILRNLMDFGIRVGTRIGKTIVFARSIKHARMMEEVFNEMYPQYGGKFCQTVVSDDPRADSLIDDFKGDGTNPDLTVAISVDMLDTGVDVPECVNLVFAKPVYSYVKFWQMIGRGTRLSPNLFGPDRDKSHFQIFDHWGNFDRFEQDYKKAEPTRQKSLCERVFEARMKLAQAALEKQHNAAFQIATGLIAQQVADLPKGSIPIKEKWNQVLAVSSEETIRQFDAATKATLEQEIAPLMQWVEISKFEEAYKFDRLIAQLQTELIRGGGKFADLRDEVVNLVSSLRTNLSQVKVKLPVIERVKSDEFWDEVTVGDLEEIRDQLRGIIQFRRKDDVTKAEPIIIDVKEDESGIERQKHKVRLDKLDDLEMVACRLVQECSTCQIVVAWATVGFDAFAHLVIHRAKIAKMVVGTHFYQTDPNFIETFLTDSNVKFVKSTDGVFHPKVYFFEKNGAKWECVVGSANFTSGGFGKNVETAVLISGDDLGAAEARGDLIASIERHWGNASYFTSAELDEYRKKFDQTEPFLNDLQGAVERHLTATNLMEFSRTLHGKTITTFASRKKEIGTLFTVKVTYRGIEFLPLSSKNKMPFISRIDEVQKICDKYERLGKSKVTSDYQNDCRTSTYLITVIDLFENSVSSRDSREFSHQPTIG